MEAAEVKRAAILDSRERKEYFKKEKTTNKYAETGQAGPNERI